MADESVCQINLEGLTKDEQKEVKAQVKKIVDGVKARPDITDVDEAVLKALDSYEEFLTVQAKVQKRNAYINKVKRQKMVDYILSNWADNPAEGFRALLGGTQIENKGGRLSVDVAINNFQNRYLNVLRSKLWKDNLFNEFKSGAFDKDIYVAMHRIDNDQPLDGLQEVAVKISKILKDLNEIVRSDSNRYGGFVRKLDGFVISRAHDMYRIKANMQGWINWMNENIDWDKSFPDVVDPQSRLELLQRQAKEFASGVHLAGHRDPDEAGIKGYSSIAKRMSKERKFHFKNPEAEFDYAKKYGYDNLFTGIISSLESKGRSNGMMSILGPNAEMNFFKAIEDVQNKFKRDGKLDSSKEMDDLGKTAKWIESNLMPQLTGRVMIPGHEVGAAFESITLFIQRTSSLGGAVIPSILGDSALTAMNVARLEKGFSGAAKGYADYLSSLVRSMDDPEVMDVLADMAIDNAYALDNFRRGMEGEGGFGKTQRRINNIQNAFFRLNLMSSLDARTKANIPIKLAQRIGRQVDKNFADVKESYRRMFGTYDIGEAEWDIARQSTKEFEGMRVIAIEQIRDLPDTEVDKYLASKGKKPTPYQRKMAKDEIINKFRAMYQDQQQYSILSADSRLRANMYGGTQSGTANSVVRKLVLQFTQFPMTFIQRGFGRELYSKSPASDKVMNMAALFLATTVGGYLTMTLRDAMAGKEPKEFNGKTVTEAMLRGGGLGVYGDYLYKFYDDKYGSTLTTFLGPTAADGETLAKAISGIVQGDPEKTGDNLARLATSNIPFANLFYLKPIVDYAFMNQVKEMISPGSLARSERRLEEDYGQEYFMLRPQETMLFQ